MKVSSVSPDRWDTIAVYPASRHSRIASRVSVTVPIWLTLINAELAIFRPIASAMIAGLVQKLSSPTSWTRSPSRWVMAIQPSWSSSARPSSMLHTGNSVMIASYRSIMSALDRASPATW